MYGGSRGGRWVPIIAIEKSVAYPFITKMILVTWTTYPILILLHNEWDEWETRTIKDKSAEGKVKRMQYEK